MHNRIFFFAFLFVAGSLALPHVAYAAGIPFFGPIVPKDVSVCAAGWGMIIVIINNIIEFLLTLAIVFILPIMIAYAGFLFVVNPVSPSGKQKAKDVLTSTIVGIAIAFSGWLIVDAVMAAMVPNGQPFGQNWASIVNWSGDACLPQKGSLYKLNEGLVQGASPTAAISVVPPSTASPLEAAIRKQFADAGVQINHSVPCNPYDANGVTNGCTNVGNMRPATVEQVIALKTVCGSGCPVMVTGGSEAGHASGTYSHGNGYKVDLSLDSVITNHLKSMTQNGIRGGGEPGPIYIDKCGKNEYVLTSNHWDITVYQTCASPF